MKVTLHEVAARAKVSIATVSRTLNGLPVSEQSRRRVEQAVAELGYVANEAARALRSDRSMTMGLIFLDLRNMLGLDLADALSEAIEAAGYSLLISTARGDAGRYDLLMYRFLERRVDALFCIRPPGGGDSLARYQRAGVPVMAMFSADGDFAATPTLSPLFSEPTRALHQHLVEGGHARVAVLRPEAGGGASDALTRGLRELGLAVEVVTLSAAGGVRDALSGLISRPDRPTAILAPDPAVRALISVCAATGLAIPGDLSVISVCDISAEAHHRRAGLSAVMVDPHRMGRAAGAAMLDWLAGAPPDGRVGIQVATFTARKTSGARAP